MKLHIDAAEVAQAVQMVGRGEFYASMLVLMGRQVRHDLLALARYSRYAPPDFISPSDFDQAAKQRYFDGLYLLDPFYRLWQDQGTPGVVTLKDVAPADLWRSRYAIEFLHEVNISDEICVFLPPLGGASVALIMDRANGNFTRAERQRIRFLYPVLATLHELHVQTVLVSGLRSTLPAASTNRALRLIDHHGIELYATPTWPAKSDLPAKACQQVRLEPDFVLAPGGTIEYFECDIHPPTSSAGLHPSIVRQLTPRESDIVRLTLAGYPTISIARRLNLSVGTVKNHRTRIFRKLDITTERELFLIQRDFTPPIAQATKI